MGEALEWGTQETWFQASSPYDLGWVTSVTGGALWEGGLLGEPGPRGMWSCNSVTTEASAEPPKLQSWVALQTLRRRGTPQHPQQPSLTFQYTGVGLDRAPSL